MKLYSTNRKSPEVDLKTAVLLGQAPDGGLYYPERLPRWTKGELETLRGSTFNQVATEISRSIFQGELPESKITEIISTAFSFKPELIKLDENLYVLELIHGPTAAFKDFGARFMGALMGYYAQAAQRTLHILVATSGDTGGAVASAFHKVPGIRVTILYPSGKVSPFQEKQLTTWGDNIEAFEVKGTFDDCQRMVKTAFTDEELRTRLWLSSANSINIARLIPQSFYYFYAWYELEEGSPAPIFSVPSGNFGNLTAGLLAREMGLPIEHFIAATNINKIVPDYLQSGEFQPLPSQATISNAMDVGNPSNFARMLEIFSKDHSAMKSTISGFYFNDDQTRAAIKELYEKYQYIACPHTAVAYLGAKSCTAKNHPIVFLSTAHPAKFSEEVNKTLDIKVPIPASLAKHLNQQKVARLIEADFAELKKHLLA